MIISYEIVFVPYRVKHQLFIEQSEQNDYYTRKILNIDNNVN